MTVAWPSPAVFTHFITVPRKQRHLVIDPQGRKSLSTTYPLGINDLGPGGDQPDHRSDYPG